MIHHGDCREVMRTFDAESIDACVTDPPYDLTSGKRGGTGPASVNLNTPAGRARIGTGGGFMGKEWDATGVAFAPETWAAVLRVLKPGAYVLAFGGTRTYHRMTCAIEDAGFEIRDCLSWLYGSGFPKSLNLPGGLGTALKPSWEPCVLARKPLVGTVAANVERFGTGAINIGACRLTGPSREIGNRERSGECSADRSYAKRGATSFAMTPGPRGGDEQGRWPANVMLDEEAAALLDEQTGDIPGAVSNGKRAGTGYGAGFGEMVQVAGYADSGGASRFYYVAKPSREERDYGTHGLTPRTGGQATDRQDGSAGINSPRAGAGRTGGSRNFHPTVKPVELMRWLVRLVAPPGGVVLDPFLGSGTTGMACRYEQREFIGIEREADYIQIAERRIAAVAPLFGGGVCA